MLAPISGTRRDGGSSFRALKNYLGFKKNQETGEMVCRSELLISESLLSERTAQAEMRAVASENLRIKDPVYHYQLCWQENEFPEKDQWRAAAEKSIRALGFEEHQYIIAPHSDTDHFHVHVMVNRVHPDTYRAHYPEFSKRTLDQAIREIEAEQGWKESKGLFRWDREQGRAIQNTREEMLAAESPDPYAGDKKANKLETHTDTESLEAYAKARPAKEIAALMKSGRKVDWPEIHSVLAKHGLELERGDKSGYKVRAVGTELRAKASSVFRETFAGKENRARLEKLEGWEAKADVKPSRTTEIYKSRPIKRDPGERAERREQRADERKALNDAYRVYKSGIQTDQKARVDSMRVQLKQITVAYCQERAAIRSGGGSMKRPAERKAALSLAAMRVATERADLQGQLKDARAATILMSYRDWVTEQAEKNGNRAAVGQLRGFAYSEQRIAAKVPAASIVIESSEEDFKSTDYRPLERQDLRAEVHRNGDVQYFQGREALLIDQGSKISLLQQSESAYVAALQLGQTKFGHRLHVTGTEAEKKAFALAAAKHDLRVEFTDDRMNVWMREATLPSAPVDKERPEQPRKLNSASEPPEPLFLWPASLRVLLLQANTGEGRIQELLSMVKHERPFQTEIGGIPVHYRESEMGKEQGLALYLRVTPQQRQETLNRLAIDEKVIQRQQAFWVEQQAARKRIKPENWARLSPSERETLIDAQVQQARSQKERANRQLQPPSREALDTQLRTIAQTKATYPSGEIRSLEEVAQRRKDLHLRPEREITGRVLGYTQGNEEALFQRIGGGLVRLDMRGKELLAIGKEISYDTISLSVSFGRELEL